MSNMKTSSKRSIVSFIVSAALIVAAIGLYSNRQYVIDQLAVWSYTPTEQIEALEERTSFTGRGRFVFRATYPALQQKEAFNKACPRQEVSSPIIGCYTGDDRIYIYDIDNEQLNGIKEVTAAHEMLHAVWARLSDARRSELSNELTAAYNETASEELKRRMQYYERTEPGQLATELHSILGTEVGSLSDSLEAYYEQYFNRREVLRLHGQYSAVYSALNERADALYAELESLAATIKERNEAYAVTSNSYINDVTSFNTRAQDGSFTTQAQFSQERAALVARFNALNAERESINQIIAQYEIRRKEYDEIGGKIKVLNDSLDSFSEHEEIPTT